MEDKGKGTKRVRIAADAANTSYAVPARASGGVGPPPARGMSSGSGGDAFDEAIEAELERRHHKKGFNVAALDSEEDDEDEEEERAANSSGDEGGAGATRKRKGGAADSEDDDDEGGSDDDDMPHKNGTKPKQRLQREDLDAQEEGDEAGFYDDTGINGARISSDNDDDNDDDDDDEDGDESTDQGEQQQQRRRNRKKKKAIKVEPFNLKREFEEGEFNEDGVYRQHKDDTAIHDSWLEGISRKDMRRAQEQQQQEQERQRRQRESRQTSTDEERLPQKPLNLWVALLGLLLESDAAERADGYELQSQSQRRGETAAGAMRRASAEAKTAAKGSAAARHAARELALLTAICDRLMSLGNFGVYEERRSAILRRLRAEGQVPADAVIPPYIRWEIRWPAGGDKGAGSAEDVFGPYGWSEMHAWAAADYFAQAGGVHYREWQGQHAEEWKYSPAGEIWR